MNAQHTVVTRQSWFSRIGGAIKGVLIGLLLFVIAFPLLFWNEGRAVKQFKSLKELGENVISVASSPVDPANEGKPVHVTGKADTEEVLTDRLFNISANALKLDRVVEMYQWQETSQRKTEKKVGGGSETTTTYSYSQTWAEHPIDSSKFNNPEGRQNPVAMPYESQRLVADRVSLDAFRLSPSLVGRIRSYEPLPVDATTTLPEEILNASRLHHDGLYFGADPMTPAVGDVRVRFNVVKPTEVSVIARQTGDTFTPYTATAGRANELLQVGIHTAGDMVQRAQDLNRLQTWILRLVGFVLMVAGLNMIFRPLSVVADVLPILGNIVGAGTGLIALLLASILSLITVSIAWVFYRPLLGILLLAAAIGLIVVIRGKLKAAKAVTPETAGG